MKQIMNISLSLVEIFTYSWKISSFFSETCRGKATVAYTKPQQRKKEKCERLRGQRDQIKFIDLSFEGAVGIMT